MVIPRGLPDEIRDDILALNGHRAELERLSGLPSSGSAAPRSDDDSANPSAPKAKRAKKASRRSSKKSAPRPRFDE